MQKMDGVGKRRARIRRRRYSDEEGRESQRGIGRIFYTEKKKRKEVELRRERTYERGKPDLHDSLESANRYWH